MTETPMPKTRDSKRERREARLGNWDFAFLDLLRISCFGFRISLQLRCPSRHPSRHRLSPVTTLTPSRLSSAAHTPSPFTSFFPDLMHPTPHDGLFDFR